MELSRLVQALSDPQAYPEPPGQIQMVQTQMSVVFLTEEYVYKLKKPVDLGYLDYSTLERRRFFCQREVELNRRLCPDAYLGVVLITRKDDRIVFGGEGEPVEYAVKMRRLPQEKMMDVLLARNGVSLEMIARVADRVSDFHARAKVVSGFGDVDTLTTNTEENFSQTEPYIGRAISTQQYERIAGFTRLFIRDMAELFHGRAEQGRVKDCHGDLHTAHICFLDGVCIYDCIEFNDRFRYCDVAAEVSFLAMDLDYHGRQDLSGAFVDAYVEKSGDRDILQLLDYYKCYFAYVRGKVACFRLDDPLVPEDEKAEALATARDYFRLADSYAGR